VALLTGAASAASFALRRSAPRTCMLSGCVTLASGSALTAIALSASSPAIFYASTALAGGGFGTAFLGAFRTLVNLADPKQRGGLVAAVYTVAYLAFAIPAVIAGMLASHIGLHHTAIGYSLAVSPLALTALLATVKTPEASRRTKVPTRTHLSSHDKPAALPAA
jgi:MFS family permease